MSTDWRTLAACRDEDPALFFAADDEKPRARQVRMAKAMSICGRCPVTCECGEFAEAHGCRSGIWAGEDLDTAPPAPEIPLCAGGLHPMTPQNSKTIAGTPYARCRECLRIADRRTRPARHARLRQRRREQQEQERAA